MYLFLHILNVCITLSALSIYLSIFCHPGATLPECTRPDPIHKILQQFEAIAELMNFTLGIP